MELVVDANILFSALIKKSTTLELLLNERLSLFAPEFVLREFSKHLVELAGKTGVREQLLKQELARLITLAKIETIPAGQYAGFLKQAEKISPDPDDLQYLALALYLNCPVWSNDRALKKQPTVKVYSTADLLEELEKQGAAAAGLK